jgi:hypothetical protein
MYRADSAARCGGVGIMHAAAYGLWCLGKGVGVDGCL